mmetsp:Transcript_61692/g.127863  ORF Transcript_61692/g.127863 Transcript_61692/m.127863 type:complete len:230 (+) Transcript_61692:37-726(+)
MAHACFDCCCSPARALDAGDLPGRNVPQVAQCLDGESTHRQSREQLQKLVYAFVGRASAAGQDCRVSRVRPPGRRQAAQYQLKDRARVLELKGSTDGSDEWQQLRAWSIGSLHLQKAETSTLSTELASDAVKSAILVSAQTETWLLILSGSEERDSFFSAMQILQLYQTLAEQCPVSTPKKGEAATPTEREGDRALLRPPGRSPISPPVSPFACKAPAPPPTPQKLDAL